MKTFDKIYKIVSKIPKGKVLTYKRVALLSGVKNPRVVGFALHANKNPDQVPCHRVVKSDGFLAKGYAFGGIKAQEEKLKKEGVVFLTKNKVDLSKSLL
jgi:methylated-DNA-protein-cysteine methyltransferase-like protein